MRCVRADPVEISSFQATTHLTRWKSALEEVLTIVKALETKWLLPVDRKAWRARIGDDLENLPTAEARAAIKAAYNAKDYTPAAEAG